ncbi:MAG: HAMP domain-containing histidine kinase, partial [Bacteroidales bacterium]|nr:HAMP domain-containing histidine kinase [Bacteroidales bacterium]
MNRNVFIFIIVIMTAALIGLMVIQSYWIRNTITVKEAGFIRSVNDAITTVIYKLERLEAMNQFKNRRDYMKQKQKWYQSMDSLNRVMFSNPSSLTDPRDLNRLFQKSVIASDVLQGMLNDYQNMPVETRVNEKILDSLISGELKMRGITTDYEYGIFNPVRNNMPVQKTGQYPKELLNEGFSFAMYPSDMVSTPNYLMVYFPKEKRFLLSQLWSNLSISIVFVIIIILSFAYTVITILRQKKVSEMKNDFINNMTHEIKTPISTISLACEALSDKDIIKSEHLYENYIGVINEENRRLGNLTERILQSATLEKGEILLKMEEVNVHELIGDAVNNIRIQVEKKGGQIVQKLNAENHML